MVFVRKWPFFQLFFLGNIGLENVFDDILEPKNAFLGLKNKNFKKSKNWHFSKNPLFWSKNDHFSNFFFFRQYSPKNVFDDILEQKNAFLGYEKRSSKSRKIDIFPNGLTHGFGPKKTIFPTFFFRKYRPRKCLWPYSRAKKRLSRL